MPSYGIGGDAVRTIEAKTADYRMTYLDLGKIITNRGASGAVVLTLPPTADVPTGWWVDTFVIADQDLTIQTPAVDTLISQNDATADSIASSTASRRIGNAVQFVWDGTGWMAFQHLAVDELAATALAGANNFSVAT